MTDPASSGGSAPAGWYPDAENPGGRRYWNGEYWTEERTPPPPPPSVPGFTAPPPEAPVTAPYSEASDNLATLGYVLAILFPIAGLIIGVMLLGRGRSRAGWQIVAISLIAPFVIAFAIGLIVGVS
jgi:Protein of unknown function (DUF2510)